jgi:hypothetical protein
MIRAFVCHENRDCESFQGNGSTDGNEKLPLRRTNGTREES